MLFLSAEIFNKTLDENERAVRRFVASALKPFALITGLWGSFVNSLPGNQSWLQKFGAPVGMIAAVGAIYVFEEPGVGLNSHSMVLFFSFLGSFVALTYIYEGGQVLLGNRYGARSVVKVVPIGIAVALIGVMLTRIEGFQPGLVYGFIAADAFTAPANLTREQKGKRIFFPAIALIVACLLAWLMLGPLREFARDEGSWWAAVPEGIAVGLFVTGLQSLFFQMVPIKFMDGHELIRWNKAAWFGVAAVTGFLFWHVLLNQQRDSIDSLGQTNTIAALVLIGASLGLSLATYVFFRYYGDGDEAEAVPADAA